PNSLPPQYQWENRLKLSVGNGALRSAYAASTFAVETSISTDRPRKSNRTRIRSFARSKWVTKTSSPGKGQSMIGTDWTRLMEPWRLRTSSEPTLDGRVVATF